MECFHEIESLERELVDPKIRMGSGRIQELLSDDFLEFGSSGKVIRKRDVLIAASKPSATTYQLSDFKFKMLGEEHVLVTYLSVTSCQQIAHRSSIWVKENGRWKMLHHQSMVVRNGI